MKNKKIIVILLLILIIISINIKVIASTEYSYKINLTANSTIAKKGDKISVNVKITNVNIENGVGSCQGTVLYDKEVFELIEIKGIGKWGGIVSDEKGNFTGVRSDAQAVSQDQEILSVIFKVKDSAEVGNSEIKISNFETYNYDDEEGTKVDNVAVNINIQNDSGSDLNESDGNENNPNESYDKEENANNKIDDNIFENDDKKQNELNIVAKNSVNIDTSKSNSKIPYTGMPKLVLFCIGLSIIVGIFSYIQYKRTY